MKIGFVGSSVLAALFASGIQQEEPAQAPSGLVKVAPSPQAPRDAEFDAHWRSRLTDPDLDRRERAFTDAVGAAAREARLSDLLRELSRDESDRELAWTARLALREIDASQRVAAPFDGWAWQLDPSALHMDFQRFFQGLESRFPQIEFPGEWMPAPQPPQAERRVERFELSVGPDGVVCKVHRDVDGQEATEEYRAESIEKLLEAHPELAERIQVGGDFGNAFGLRGGGARRQGIVPTIELGPVRTDILGVIVHPLDADNARALGLEAGTGLVVERVEPGTIARSLGLERGHVLVELNGRTLRKRDDISEELKARASEAPVEVVIVDRWGQRRERAWKPDGARQL